MKRIYVLIILSFLMSAPTIQSNAAAQHGKKERVAKKKRYKRKARRKVNRRVKRKAHVKYATMTRYGATVAVIPNGAVVVRRSNVVYHYYDGVFYKPSGKKYIVVRAIPGIRIKRLPVKHIRVVATRGVFYYYYGTYYRQTGDEYEVVTAPNGAIVDALPEGYEIKKIDGTEYYYWDDVYYQEIETYMIDSGIGYQVVSMG